MNHSSTSHKAYDTAIIGGGILGLWAARHAIKRNESVLLIEKRNIGSGASGGFLGALMPHMPDLFNQKKIFQYNCLSNLDKVIYKLEKDSRLSCGFRRCGRIMPIPHEKMLDQVERRIAGASENWAAEFILEKASIHNAAEGWINPEVATYGIQRDTLAARINPRAYMHALETYIRPRTEILENTEAVKLEFKGNAGEILLENGERISAGKVIVCNGWEAYPLLQPYMDNLNNGKPIGRGVKGQAVLVEYAHNDDLPIVYHDGSYIVPHENNRVAIGSTSENDWQNAPNPEPDAFNPDNMDFYQKAIELVPALKDAPIINRWAAVRPRNTLEGRGTSPWFGPVPGQDNLIALIGGFKITFGIAHLDFTSEPFTD